MESRSTRRGGNDCRAAAELTMVQAARAGEPRAVDELARQQRGLLDVAVRTAPDPAGWRTGALLEVGEGGVQVHGVGTTELTATGDVPEHDQLAILIRHEVVACSQDHERLQPFEALPHFALLPTGIESAGTHDGQLRAVYGVQYLELHQGSGGRYNRGPQLATIQGVRILGQDGLQEPATATTATFPSESRSSSISNSHTRSRIRIR